MEFYYDEPSSDRSIDMFDLELAQPDTKTKEMYEFKEGLKEGDTVDAHDKTSWNRSTILEI